MDAVGVERERREPEQGHLVRMFGMLPDGIRRRRLAARRTVRTARRGLLPEDGVALLDDGKAARTRDAAYDRGEGEAARGAFLDGQVLEFRLPDERVADEDRFMELQAGTGVHPARKGQGRHHAGGDRRTVGAEPGRPEAGEEVQDVPSRRHGRTLPDLDVIASEGLLEQRHGGRRRKVFVGLLRADVAACMVQVVGHDGDSSGRDWGNEPTIRGYGP